MPSRNLRPVGSVIVLLRFTKEDYTAFRARSSYRKAHQLLALEQLPFQDDTFRHMPHCATVQSMALIKVLKSMPTEAVLCLLRCLRTLYSTSTLNAVSGLPQTMRGCFSL